MKQNIEKSGGYLRKGDDIFSYKCDEFHVVKWLCILYCINKQDFHK